MGVEKDECSFGRGEQSAKDVPTVLLNDDAEVDASLRFEENDSPGPDVADEKDDMTSTGVGPESGGNIDMSRNG